MAVRVPLFWMMPLWMCAILRQAVEPSEPPHRQPEPALDAAIQETSPESAIGVDEAVRLAIDALNRLEARNESDALVPLMDQANRYIELVETKDAANSWLPYLYGRAYALMGRRGDAVDRLVKFVETREGRNEWRAYRLLGDLFVDEFPRLAKANYEKARTLNPAEPTVLFGLSVCASRLGDREGAISLARETLKVDGARTIRYVSHLAGLLSADGQSSEAFKEAQRALDLAQASMQAEPGAHRPLLVVDGQYQQMIDILQARVNEPAHTDISDYLLLAATVRQRAQIRQMLMLHDVLRVIEAGVDKTAPGTPPALLEQYGIVLAEVGRTDAAVDAFEKLLGLDPNNKVAAEWLTRLQPDSIKSQQTKEP